MRSTENKRKKVPDIVKAFLLSRPLLLKYAMDGLVNTSALARVIKKETGIKKSDEAVIVSLHRFLSTFEGIPKVDEKTARDVLENTSVNIRTDYAVAVVEGFVDFKADVEIYFGKTSVFIGEESSLNRLKQKSIFYRDALALIELKHKKNIEDIPGIMFHILSRFYEKNISVVEMFSAWNATYIVVDKKNIKDVFEMFFTQPAE
jgi:hypothetical protein